MRARLLEAGVRPSKRLGQHFLLMEELAHRMVEYASIQRGEVVLEVGPGLGVLTEALLRRADRVVAIEVDPRLSAYLSRRFPDLELVEGDVLHADLPPFDRVVSNLPYEISSPFTFKLLDTSFKRAVLTYQREFAERMVAGHGTKTYSRVSVKVYYRCLARILETVPRSAFWPQPKVDSAVVQIDTRPPPFQVDEAGFQRVVDALFAHRRKTALNALLHSWQRLAPSRDQLKAVLVGTPFASKRAEEMSPEEMAELSSLLFPPKG
ncbi:MAG: 16S rRNA (adenine(1518)-N(6)/adenine(1519)-N(6))-dimethyltransferase RsmA [Thermoplasmata archaeon]